jgi:hypothetical protein
VYDPLGYSSDQLKRRKTLIRFRRDRREGFKGAEIDFNFLQNWPKTLAARVLPLDGLRDQWMESQYIFSPSLGISS